MNNIIKKEESLVSYVKSVVLKYCPYVDDRLSILGNAKAPQFNIEFNIGDKQSRISFLFGNRTFKQSTLEQVVISELIDFKEIKDIMDFIIGDHQYLKSINLYNRKFELCFSINWNNESIKGINCGDIRLNLSFSDKELAKQYLYLLFQNYYTYFKKFPSFKAIKDEYINGIKQPYFNTLNKDQLMELLNKMNEIELKELLYGLDNDLFIKYTSENNQQSKTKKLFLEKTNNK